MGVSLNGLVVKWWYKQRKPHVDSWCLFMGDERDFQLFKAEKLVADVCNAHNDALRRVADNFDKCRLIDRSEAERHLEKGNGYMGVPHEECLDEIRAALAELSK